MRVFLSIRICVLCTLVLIGFFLYWTKYHGTLVRTSEPKQMHIEKVQKPIQDMYLAVVCCGDRFQETITMLKSAVMFTQEKINLLVVSETSLIERFNEKLAEWQETLNYKFGYRVLPLSFPVDNKKEWKKLFKPCAAQRLFLPVSNRNIFTLNVLILIYI